MPLKVTVNEKVKMVLYSLMIKIFEEKDDCRRKLRPFKVTVEIKDNTSRFYEMI